MNDDMSRKNLDLLYKRYDKFARNISIILAFLFISQLGLGVWNLNLAKDNTTRTEEIQTSRKNSILINCEEQNSRNENTIVTLNNLLDKIKAPTQAELNQLQQTKDFTIVLINSLAPKQNCIKRVQQLTKP